LKLLQFKAFIPICIASLLGVLLAFGLWSSHKIHDEANTLLQQTNQIRQALHTENYKQAQLNCSLLTLQWDAYQNHWTMLINHQEMDRIYESMKKLNQFVYFEDAVDAWAELDTLIHFIKHIPQKETLSIQNFF
jgi:hypothetical protein